MRRSRAIAGSNILVQVIHVTWDKSGRGGAGAERRNRIPLALPLPSELTPEPGRHLLVHESHWGHTNDFAEEISSKTTVLDAAAEFRYRCASIRQTAMGVELEWRWSDQEGLQPQRIWNAKGAPVPARHLSMARENEWVRARWNGRFAGWDTGAWWYEAVTVNVGVFPTSEIPSDFFTCAQPAEELTELAYLW